MALSQLLELNTVPEQLCIVINIVSDTVVENDEMFFINLSTFDSAVNITRGNSSIVILDDTGLYNHAVMYGYLDNECNCTAMCKYVE